MFIRSRTTLLRNGLPATCQIKNGRVYQHETRNVAELRSAPREIKKKIRFTYAVAPISSHLNRVSLSPT